MNGQVHITVSSSGFVANGLGPIAVHGDGADVLYETIANSLEGIDFSSVTGMTVSGTESGLVVLDDLGQPLRPIIWAHDTASTADASWCIEKYSPSWWMNEVGVIPDHGHTVSKLSWLHRTEPQCWEQIAYICSPADFVRWRLVNGVVGTVMTTVEEAERTALWSPQTHQYSQKVLHLIDAQRDWSGLLPIVGEPGAIAGSIHGTLVHL